MGYEYGTSDKTGLRCVSTLSSTQEGEQTMSISPKYTAQMIFNSSNTWIGANKTYTPTSTSWQTSDSVVSGNLLVKNLLSQIHN